MDRASTKELTEAICRPAHSESERAARREARLRRARLLFERAESLVKRGARQSEQRPLFDHDAVTLCTMCMNDVRDVIAEAPGTLEAHELRLAAARCALPSQIQSVAIEALSYFPEHEAFVEAVCTQAAAASTDADDTADAGEGPATTRPSVVAAVRTLDDGDGGFGEFDCVMCMKLFLDPVTTACGHTFCRTCLSAALDHSVERQQCPLCRSPLHMNVASHPVTVVLQNIMRTCFPEQLARRIAEAREALAGGGDGGEGQGGVLPLFVCNLAFPGHTMGFNIFEPRYRLMMKRCLEGSRTFGLVEHVYEGGDDDGTDTTVATVGTLVRIVDSQVQPDGRLLMSVEGQSRFHVANSWEVDGYRVARVEFFSDDPTTGDDDLAEARGIATKVHAMVLRVVPERQHSRIPSLSDPATAAELEAFSLWACGLAQSADADQLRCTSTTERLRWLDGGMAAVAGRCVVM